MERFDFQLIAPPHTPFDSGGRLALDVVDSQAEHLADGTIDGVFVAGSTGEFSSLTVDERMQLAERWIAAAGARDMRVIVHVGHNCQADAIRLAKHARTRGADAVACNAPSYFRPRDIETLVDFLVPVAEAAGAPFYYYHIPRLTRVEFGVVEVLETAAERVGNLAGVKFTSSDLTPMPRLMSEFGDTFEVFLGCDEMLLPALALGVRSAVGSTYNWAAPMVRELIAAWARGDQRAARGLQLKANQMIELLDSYGYLPAAKSMMSLLGIDCGPVRPPLKNLTDEELKSLRIKNHVLDVLDLPTG